MDPENTPNITQRLKNAGSHVVRNRGRYGFVAGIIAGGYVIRHLDNETYKEAVAFIEYKGLTKEFFTPELHD